MVKQWNSKTFKAFKIEFRSSKKNIEIECNVDWERFTVSVSGTDSIWVGGLTKKIEEILDKYKTKNNFFYKSRAYAIYFGISLLIGIGMLLIVDALIWESMSDLETNVDKYPSSTLPYLSIALLLLMAGVSVWGWESLFHWLFPKIELEDSVSVKRRKGILGGIAAIIFSLIGGGILLLVQNLS